MSQGLGFYDTTVINGAAVTGLGSPLAPAMTLSGTNYVTGANIKLTSWAGVTFDCRWSASVTGTIAVEASLDGVTFYNVGASVTTQPSGSATGVLIQNVGIVAKFVRVSYTGTAGSGTMTVYGFARERGV